MKAGSRLWLQRQASRVWPADSCLVLLFQALLDGRGFTLGVFPCEREIS